MSAQWAVKCGLVILLCFQNTAETVVMRQSRTASSVQSISQTGVILSEVVKFVLSIGCLLLGGESPRSVASSRHELVQASVPALVYLVQNNLQYIAISYLDAATFAITYQLKILSTALLSVWLLNKYVNTTQWWALRLLVAGVAMVQVANGPASQPRYDGGHHDGFFTPQTVTGLAAILVATILSGVSGVYTEMILKKTSVSLWARNAQISCMSMAIGFVMLAASDDLGRVRREGFFVGYNAWTVSAILLKSGGGLLVAGVIKYADNIVKSFSTAMSAVLTTAISVVCLGLQVRPTFLIGVGLVCYSTLLYGGLDLGALLTGFPRRRPQCGGPRGDAPRKGG